MPFPTQKKTDTYLKPCLLNMDEQWAITFESFKHPTGHKIPPILLIATVTLLILIKTLEKFNSNCTLDIRRIECTLLPTEKENYPTLKNQWKANT